MAFVECRERELQIHSHNFLCLLRRAKLPERKLCTMRYRHHHSPRSLALHSLHNGARTKARAKEKMQIKVRENKKAINNLDWDGWWLEIMQQKGKEKKSNRPTLNTPNYLRLFISNSSQHHQQQRDIAFHIFHYLRATTAKIGEKQKKS